MGILNITPDSFSDGGKFLEPDAAIKRAKEMVSEGADIIDIGAESTRPGSDPVSENEELERLTPVVEALVKEIKKPISIDTTKPNVAKKMLKIGASILNDITGLKSQEMINVAREFDCTVIIMHMLGTPQTMQQNIHYNNVVENIKNFFTDKIKAAKLKKLILDPGIGFGKEVHHNLEIIKNLHSFKELGYPILIGPSRKSFIGKILDEPDPSKRLEGTLASVVLAVAHGADIVRVHDIKENSKAIKIAKAIINS